MIYKTKKEVRAQDRFEDPKHFLIWTKEIREYLSKNKILESIKKTFQVFDNLKFLI